MNEKLRDFDPQLYDSVSDCLDKHEIRAGSSERIIIEDWLADALIKESMLNLLRDGFIEITGLRTDPDEDGNISFEPLFQQFSELPEMEIAIDDE